MKHQTISVAGQDFVLVPRADYESLASRTSAGIDLPPLPEADKDGNRPAVAFARATIARGIIGDMNRLGVTQAELARESGVPAATLNRILKGTRSADESTVLKIEAAIERRERGESTQPATQKTVKLSDVQAKKRAERDRRG